MTLEYFATSIHLHRNRKLHQPPKFCLFGRTPQYDFVVKTIGACTVRPDVCLVQERSIGSLFDLLHSPDEHSMIPMPEKAAMLYDVARGLQVMS